MDLHQGETVLFEGRPSWRSILSFYITGLLIAVLAGVIAGIVTRISSNKVEVGWVIPAVLVGAAASMKRQSPPVENTRSISARSDADQVALSNVVRSVRPTYSP